MVDRLGRTRRHYGGKGRRYWTRERMIECAQEWHSLFGEPPRASDWDPDRMRKLAARLREKAAEWEERIALCLEQDWPPIRTVRQTFGTWNELIVEAGLSPRAPGQCPPRATEPSPLLIEVGRAMTRVYEAEDSGDSARLVVALRDLEREARDLRKMIESTLS